MFKTFFRALLISIFVLLIHPADQATLSESFSDPVFPQQQEQTEWWVSPDGNDSTGDGSLEKPFGTIQHAIDLAQDGDVVVVLEGRYSGPGNRNLDYKGKAITVRSRDPEDTTCLRNTIIDAEGQGVIVRFINDEGPDSVFEGFSLMGGNTSQMIRGAPGFFELSELAKPTTERLRNLSDESLVFGTDSVYYMAPPSGGRYWDGNNPFHQPSQTTDYYGSGDVNRDGLLTSEDAIMAQQMIDGLIGPHYTADVDGDGMVKSNDVTNINSALNGGNLPGWWNTLSGRAEREAWLTKMLVIDQSNQHPYIADWFVCRHFALQTFLHFSFYRGDLFHTEYDGGQTFFNVPMFRVGLTKPPHAINAVLVGDNPLNFGDWRFVEPQNDMDVHPGEWNMHYGSDVDIMIPDSIDLGGEGKYGPTKIQFHVDETGWKLIGFDSNMMLYRPDPQSVTKDNHPDLWNPRLIPANGDLLFFERAREDFSHTTDIHYTKLPLIDPPTAYPLVLSSQYSRSLDAALGTDGVIHLLWYGMSNYTPSIFYGMFDLVDQELTNISRITSETHIARMGRILVSSENEVHIFWLRFDNHGNSGIYWTRWTESGWETELKLVSIPDFNAWGWVDWTIRDALHYLFDATFLKDGRIMLVSAKPTAWDSDNSIVQQLLYNGSWGIPSDIETANVRGIDLLTDLSGDIHLAYWSGNIQNSYFDVDGRGPLFHRIYHDSSWSASEVIDNSNTCCPRMEVGNQGEVFLVWERGAGGQAVPVWKQFLSGTWTREQILSVLPGTDSWYPMPVYSPYGNRLIILWSSRSFDRVTIETEVIPLPAPAHLNVSSTTDSGPGSLRWAIASLADGGAIDFEFSQPTTIQLNSGALVIDKPVTINGANHVTLNAGQRSRVFDVLPDGELNLRGVTITDGYVQQASSEAQPEGGGGIRNRGTLNLTGSVLKNNQADYGGAIHNSGTSTIRGSVLMDNRAVKDGGGIYNDGELRVRNTAVVGNHAFGGGGVMNWADGRATFKTCEISGNTATNGGGLENGDRGKLIIQNKSTIQGNEATAIGGGIINYGTGIVEIKDSTLSDNTANQHGGGIYNVETAKVSITRSFIETNHAGYGGGVCNTGSMMITSTHFTSNSAEYDGGASFNAHGVLTIERSTIGGLDLEYGNRAIGGGGILNWDGGEVILRDSALANNQATNGGAIENGAGGLVVVSNSTLANNYASSAGGGVINFETGEVEILDSTVAWNDAESGGNIKNVSPGKVTLARSILAFPSSGGNCAGAVSSTGYNLADDKSCNLSPSQHDVPNTPAQIDPLTDAGGSTLTCPLQPGSPAINRVPYEDCPMRNDQRTAKRQQGPACDIGAYEMINLSIEDVSVYEGDVGNTEAHFNVSYPGPPMQEIQFNYGTADGAAVAMSDYIPVAGTLTISDEETFQTITVSVIGDTLEEPEEIFYVLLNGATNAIIWDNTGEATILDDDKAIVKYNYIPIVYHNH